MPDLTAIGTALSSIKTATDLAKLIRDSSTSLEQAEVKLQLAELVSSLAHAKMEIASVQELLIQKDHEIAKLKEAISLKEKIEWAKPYYFLLEGDSKDGPFCQNCYDGKGQLIRLQTTQSKGLWECLQCGKRFHDSDYTPPGPVRITGRS